MKQNMFIKKILCLTIFILLGNFSAFSALKGDASHDGTINILDSLLVAQFYVGLDVSINQRAADTNCDQKINIIDALLIAQYYVGLISEFPCPPTVNPTTVPQSTQVPIGSGPPLPGKWVAIAELTDEFNGSRLDLSKWQKNHPYWKGREPSQYNAANVSVGNGTLQLKSSVSNYNKTGNWVWAACVTSKKKSVQSGCYYETRIKCSDISMTSAFWMQGKYRRIH